MGEIIFWKDEKRRVIDPRLFSTVAEDMAKKTAEDPHVSKGRLNKRTQIRRFYDEVLRLHQLAQARPDQWENILPQVHMLTAKAAYAKGRDLISDGFLDFTRRSVEQVHDRQDLSVFANFFEAFMGFYRLYGPKD